MARETDGQYVFERVAAQRTSTLIQVCAVAGALTCVGLAARLQEPINQQRKELQLVTQSEVYKELPPEYAWTSAFLGAFRGIAVHYLWKRADELKEEGKYYESQQLARWICTLQPRFAEVWAFQAWNMSYNISVATHTAQERWQWVYNGIRLLRDEGIPNNDRIMRLYRELTWIWFHKVGDRTDEHHNYYKRVWAATMETLLGPPPPGATDEQTINWFRPVAEAPGSLAELIARRPKVADLVSALRIAGVDVEVATRNDRVFHPLEEQFFKPYTRFVQEKSFAGLRTGQQEITERERKLAEFFAASAGEDFDALLAWMRAKVLREQYKMDPAFMLEMTGNMGTARPIPLDWRTPWSQAIYWSMYGMAKTEKAKNVQEIDRINTDRVMVYGLQNLSRMGRYIFRLNLDVPFKSFLATGPDPRFVEAMHNKYIELGKKYAEPGEDIENRTCEMLQDGHVNFLEEMIMAFYFSGWNDTARMYLEYLAKYYPDPNTKQPKEIYHKTVDEFTYAKLGEVIDTYPATAAMIGSLLKRGYMALAAGDRDGYGGAIRNAVAVYKKYQEGSFTTEHNRLRLPDFPSIRALALFNFVANSDVPMVDIPLVVRSNVWRTEEEEIKRYCYHYDMPGLLASLKRECDQENLDVKRAFPEPSNIKEWLKLNPAPTLQEDLEKAKPAGERTKS